MAALLKRLFGPNPPGMSFVKRAFYEKPDLSFGLVVGFVGLGLLGVVTTRDLRKTPEELGMHRYKYTVIRDTDVSDPKKLGTLYN